MKNTLLEWKYLILLKRLKSCIKTERRCLDIINRSYKVQTKIKKRMSILLKEIIKNKN